MSNRLLRPVARMRRVIEREERSLADHFREQQNLENARSEAIAQFLEGAHCPIEKQDQN